MRNSIQSTILDGATTLISGRSIDAQDFKSAVFSFATSGLASLTVRFQGSNEEVCPNFSLAQSVTNMWDNLEVVDLQSGAAVAGDTGVSVAGVDDFRNLEANFNGMRWICATVTARTAGAVTVKVRLFED
jgi:hypothetical protein